MLPLQARRQLQSTPAHCKGPVHEPPLPPSEEEQQALCALPQAQVPFTQLTLLLHMLPPQQACPGSPHAHLLADVQVRLGLQIDPQQGSPAIWPQRAHDPFTHCIPTPHAGLHVAMVLSPPMPASLPESPPDIIIMLPSVPEVVPSLVPPSDGVVAASGGSVTGIDEWPVGGVAVRVVTPLALCVTSDIVAQ